MKSKGKTWQGYSAATTDQAARVAFVKRYGREPAELNRSGGGVLAGPLTVQEVGHD